MKEIVKKYPLETIVFKNTTKLSGITSPLSSFTQHPTHIYLDPSTINKSKLLLLNCLKS